MAETDPAGEFCLPLLHVEMRIIGRGPITEILAIRGLSSHTEVVDHAFVDDAGRPFVAKVPGPTRWSNIFVTRPLDRDRSFWDWRQEVLADGVEAAQADGTISMLDGGGNPVATYSFANGWPMQYAVLALGPAIDEGACERIVICHEGLQRE